MSLETIESIADQIDEYARLESSESGEYWRALVSLARCESSMPEPFRKAFVKELCGTLKFIKANCLFEVTEKSVVQRTVKIVWVDEQ